MFHALTDDDLCLAFRISLRNDGDLAATTDTCASMVSYVDTFFMRS